MSRKIFARVLALAVLAFANPLAAEEASQLAAKFGAREQIRQISLSPDGNQVAFVASVDDFGQALFVADVNQGGVPRRVLDSTNANEKFRWCAWASQTRLMCQIGVLRKDTGLLLSMTRMIAVNSDGSGVARLTEEASSSSLGFLQFGGTVIDWNVANKPGTVLMTRKFLPEFSTGTMLASSANGLGVEEVDSLALTRRTVEPARKDASVYVTDGHGHVRLMMTQGDNSSGYDSDKLRYFYRKPDSRSWALLSIVQLSAIGSIGLSPVAVDDARNLVYGFDHKDGLQALFSVALDGTGRRELVLSRPDVDVDNLIRIGRDHRIVGASFATERRSTEFFDPELKRLQSALGKALPGSPLIDFVDASTGETKLLMLATSDTDPGKFYVFDKASRQLAEVLPVRPELEGVTLAQMRPVSFPAADGTQIPGYLTLPPGSTGKGLPAIVMPHGGPGSRDEWGFDWLVQFYASRGFAVLQPNFRGSSGYGSAWYRRNGFQSWRTAIGDVNDAGRWLLAQGTAAPGKLGIFGWSYGGYAALQSSVLDPDLFKAIVAVAPVTDLESLRGESRQFTNFDIVDAYIGRGPHVREGSPAQNATAIKAPVLMFHGDFDANVRIDESRLMAKKLRDAGKQVELIEFSGLDHQLDSVSARTRLLMESDTFLRRNLGIAP